MKLLEIIVALGILMIIVAGAAGSFGGLRGVEALVSSTETVVSALSTARSQTLAAKDGVRYGVHFASTTVTIFPGSVWSLDLASTTVFNLVPGTVISALALQGGGVDLVFDRLTGKTSQYGATTIQATGSLATTTVIVGRTGIISSQ